MIKDKKLIPSRIFITGYIGSQRLHIGKMLAEKLNYQLIILDEIIEQRDGRTIKRLIMMMGEHEYRNKEYEILKEYSTKDNFVMVCSDGVVHDEMNLDILKNNPTIFLNESPEILWERAKEDNSGLYAFLYDSNKESAKRKFYELYNLRLSLYEACSNLNVDGTFK